MNGQPTNFLARLAARTAARSPAKGPSLLGIRLYVGKKPPAFVGSFVAGVAR